MTPLKHPSQVYRRYTWAANRIADEDMAAMHNMKMGTGKHITEMVAEAVKEYVLKHRTGEAHL